MSISETIIKIFTETVRELNDADIPLGIKILALFGFVFLFQTVSKTGISIISFLLMSLDCLNLLYIKL